MNTCFLLPMELCKIILLNKRKSQEKYLDRSFYWRPYKKHWARRKIITTRRDLVGFFNYWATGGSMASKGEMYHVHGGGGGGGL